MSLIFYGVFTASKVGKTGITVTVDVDQLTRADGTRTALVTGALDVVARTLADSAAAGP